MAATASISTYVTLDGIDSALARILRNQERITRRLTAIEQAIDRNTINDIITTEALMANFDELYTELTANGDAVDSAVTLLTDLATRLIDAADDPVEIRAIADALGAQSTTLAEAVVANTPAAPEPPAEPTPA